MLAGMLVAHGPLASMRPAARAAERRYRGSYMTAEFAYASGARIGKDRAVSGVATLGMIGNLTFASAPALGVFLWQHGIGRSQYGFAAGAGCGGGALCLSRCRRATTSAARREARADPHASALAAGDRVHPRHDRFARRRKRVACGADLSASAASSTVRRSSRPRRSRRLRCATRRGGSSIVSGRARSPCRPR
jgi:hypothetical protein